MAESEDTQNPSIVGLVVLVTGAALALWFIFSCILNSFVPEDGTEELQIVLTNMATIAGIVSGLSLAGFSLLITSRKGVTALVRRYGRLVHVLFLFTYFLTVAASLACALVSGSANQELMIFVGSGAAALMLAGVILTVALIHSVFGWIRTFEYLNN